jgi:hypothetical protein
MNGVIKGAEVGVMANATTPPKKGMGIIRRYRDGDADGVCALHQRVFVNAMPPGTTGAQFGAHMRELTEGSPWHTEEVGPLVLEDSAGAIRGFLCVLPRQFRYRDRAMLGAVCSTLCIDREFQGYSGTQMLRQALSGPQEFSVSDDANDIAAQVAVHTGCSIYQLQSVRWTLPLRPGSLALSFGLNRLGLGRARWLGSGVASLVDRAMRRYPQSPAQVKVDTTLTSRPMDIDAMMASMSRACRGYTLRVDYDSASLGWMMRRAHRMTQAGEPRMAMICEPDGSVAGWYTYYLRKHSLCDVVQFLAKVRFRRRVFDWMVHDAWQAGAGGLTGRLDPDMMEIISNQYCLFQPQPHWMLVQSRDPELTRTVLAGGALLSRLDGEWAHHYPHTPAS